MITLTHTEEINILKECENYENYYEYPKQIVDPDFPHIKPFKKHYSLTTKKKKEKKIRQKEKERGSVHRIEELIYFTSIQFI